MVELYLFLVGTKYIQFIFYFLLQSKRIANEKKVYTMCKQEQEQKNSCICNMRFG